MRLTSWFKLSDIVRKAAGDSLEQTSRKAAISLSLEGSSFSLDSSISMLGLSKMSSNTESLVDCDINKVVNKFNDFILFDCGFQFGVHKVPELVYLLLFAREAAEQKTDE